MTSQQLPLFGLAVSLGISLLVGAERERRKGHGLHRSAAGIRTFALTPLAGSLTIVLGGEVLLAVAAANVAAFSVISNPKTLKQDLGLTSEMVLFAALFQGHRGRCLFAPSAAISLRYVCGWSLLALYLSLERLTF